MEGMTAAWVLSRALELAGSLPAPRREELFERLGVDAREPERWQDVSRRLRVPFHRGVISQFDGYGRLAELDWDGYRARYGDIRRLDRILEAEGDSVNRYQASKQADVLMLGYLFPPAELAALFRRLGVRYRDHWGVGLTLYSGRLHVRVPESGRSPLPVALGDRVVRVPPGTEVALDLPAACRRGAGAAAPAAEPYLWA
jgi:hypothetical protein